MVIIQIRDSIEVYKKLEEWLDNWNKKSKKPTSEELLSKDLLSEDLGDY